MQADFYNNMSSIVKDGLIETLERGDRISMAAALFSIYGYAELREQLDECESFRFVYTEPTFLKSEGEKERREYYIPRLKREQGIGGTEFEIKLKNELKQKALARECADWIRRKGEFRSYSVANRAACAAGGARLRCARQPAQASICMHVEGRSVLGIAAQGPCCWRVVACRRA